MNQPAVTLDRGRRESVSGYRGVLDDAHIRAVVREALRARGFEPDPDDLAAEFNEQWRLGILLRDRLIVGRLPPFADSESYRALETESPYLWARLPPMAALGFRQARAIEALTAASPEDQDAAILAATFNAAIASLDYAVDDLGASDSVFGLVDAAVVRSIFENHDVSTSALTECSRTTSDPIVRLLLALIGSCAEQGWALYSRHANHEAWRHLGSLVGRMFEAERLVSDPELGVGASDASVVRVRAAAGSADRVALITAARDKSVLPSMATLQIVALASKDPSRVADLAEVAETLGGVFSLVDDLADVLADSRAGRLTVLTSRLESAAAAGARPRPADADVYDAVYSAADDAVRLLDRLEDVANDRAATAGGSADEVVRFSRHVLAAWAGWHQDATVLSPAASADVPPAAGHRSRGPADQLAGPLARRATRFLLAQQQAGYPEAMHHLHFPRLTSAGIAHETHPALLAQRSVILDALLDARAAGIEVSRVVLASEVMSVLQSKHRDVRGGWSYIPQVPELPPDADDVGQVLQELCRVGGPVLGSTCDEGIRFVLDAARADGAFSTWILDPRGRSSHDELVRGYLPVMGGAGIHPEVMANFLYGLILYGRERYAGPLARSASYLESVQSEDGSWASKWYAGPYYGTFRVLWVLGSLGLGETAISRARRFLLGTQARSGGWGREGADPLSTALAMLSLAAPNTAPAPAAIRGGATFLTRTADSDGSWPGVPWIVFPTADGQESYGSRTISTAFCLKALLVSGTTRA